MAQPPPPYDFTDSKHANKEKSDFPQQPPPASDVSRASTSQRFPTSFNVYSKSGWGKTYFIALHRDQPLFQLVVHSGWGSGPDLELKSGPDKSCSDLATAKLSKWKSQVTLTLPASVTTDGSADLVTEMKQHSGWTSAQNYFTASVVSPQGVGLRTETFEWRRSHGVAVKDLGGSSHGRKLVRLVTDAGAAAGAAGAAAGGTAANRSPSSNNTQHQSSDGGEVVAVFTASSWTGHKIAKFEFLGSGANGALGEQWALLAVISALALMEADRRRAAASGASAGAAGGSGC